MEVLISKTLIDSNLSDDCISVNDIIEEFNDMKEAIKNLKLILTIKCKKCQNRKNGRSI